MVPLLYASATGFTDGVKLMLENAENACIALPKFKPNITQMTDKYILKECFDTNTPRGHLDSENSKKTLIEDFHEEFEKMKGFFNDDRLKNSVHEDMEKIKNIGIVRSPLFKKSALMIACDQKHLDLVNLIFNYDFKKEGDMKIEFNLKDDLDKTALTYACLNKEKNDVENQEAIIRMFLTNAEAKEIDLNAVDKKNKTAFDYLKKQKELKKRLAKDFPQYF